MLLGVHVSIAESIAEAPRRAARLKCQAMQIFPRNPQKWRERLLSDAEIQAFRDSRQACRISTVFVHMPYLGNLASPNRVLVKASIKAYIEDIQESFRLGADYIVSHMGSHKDTAEYQGLKRFAQALDSVLKKTRAAPVPVLLENTAGSGSWLGGTFKHHKVVFKSVKERQRLGICIDTAHAYASGYDIASSAGLEKMLAEIGKTAGVESIGLIHLNDSKDALGSHRDRHEHIGKGFIGTDGMKRIINHPLLRNRAFILETPKTTPQDDPRNLVEVLRLRQGE